MGGLIGGQLHHDVGVGQRNAKGLEPFDDGLEDGAAEGSVLERRVNPELQHVVRSAVPHPQHVGLRGAIGIDTRYGGGDFLQQALDGGDRLVGIDADGDLGAEE